MSLYFSKGKGNKADETTPINSANAGMKPGAKYHENSGSDEKI